MQSKIPTSLCIEINQKKAMQVISTEIGIPMTTQIKFGLDEFLLKHKELLLKKGFQFDINNQLTITK